MIKILSYSINKTQTGKKRLVKLRAGNKQFIFNNKSQMNEFRRNLSNRLKADIYVHYQDLTKQIFVMNGSGGSGKDTFVNMLNVEHLKLSYADYAKEQLGLIEGKYQKTNEVRKRLADFIDKNSRDCFLNLVVKLDSIKNVAFVDIREPIIISTFVEFCKDIYKITPTTVYIDRKTDAKGNHADDNTANFIYDYYVDNNKGLEDLKKQANKFKENFQL